MAVPPPPPPFYLPPKPAPATSTDEIAVLPSQYYEGDTSPPPTLSPPVPPFYISTDPPEPPPSRTATGCLAVGDHVVIRGCPAQNPTLRGCTGVVLAVSAESTTVKLDSTTRSAKAAKNDVIDNLSAALLLPSGGVRPGCLVRIVPAKSRSDLTGKRAVVKAWNAKHSRWAVESLDDTEQLCVLPSRLELIDEGKRTKRRRKAAGEAPTSSWEEVGEVRETTPPREESPPKDPSALSDDLLAVDRLVETAERLRKATKRPPPITPPAFPEATPFIASKRFRGAVPGYYYAVEQPHGAGYHLDPRGVGRLKKPKALSSLTLYN